MSMKCGVEFALKDKTTGYISIRLQHAHQLVLSKQNFIFNVNWASWLQCT